MKMIQLGLRIPQSQKEEIDKVAKYNQRDSSSLIKDWLRECLREDKADMKDDLNSDFMYGIIEADEYKKWTDRGPHEDLVEARKKLLEEDIVRNIEKRHEAILEKMRKKDRLSLGDKK